MLILVINENNEPVIKLAGSYLVDAGFKIGDILNLSFSENEIRIKKSLETEKLTKMQNNNPSIKKLIKELNLDIDF